MRRRDFSKLTIAASAAVALPGCLSFSRAAAQPTGHRVFAIAFDGLDPRVVNGLLRRNRMPNLARLAARGSFSSLATSTPPQTPVAFSSIISGADPGMHHIFDFIQRHPSPDDPQLAVQPYFSSADAEKPANQWELPLGDWELPLTGSQTRLLRRGPAFWDALIANGVDAGIYYLPANYPPPQPEGPGTFRCISGMGTPDLLGDYGTFTLFTPDVPPGGREVGGGRFAYLSMVNNYAQAELQGPSNYLRRTRSGEVPPPMKARIDLARDPFYPVARISIGTRTVLLNEGEWSGWLPVVFETGFPGSTVLDAVGAPVSVAGIVRLYMKQVHPKFELYVSPVNIDPLAPVNPISVPPELAQQLAERHGRFYTAGIPEDTKALSHGALNEEQFLAQSAIAQRERVEQFRQVLSEFRQGCLFYYFGATDLLQHMFWRDRDELHPGRSAEQQGQFANVVDDTYREIDHQIGDVLKVARESDTVIVLSDHGFNSFRRGFNLNRWLAREGYMRAGAAANSSPLFPGVNWSGTQAYGLGMNGLYLNIAGREKHGIVREEQRRSLLNELRDKLMAVHDVNGKPVIHRIDLVEDIYPAADLDVAPDLIIGYEEGYRASWDTVLGGLPPDVLVDNLDRWSGTHLISPDLVPGILVTNRPVAVRNPDIRDIAPTILAEFGISPMSHMTGRPLFGISPRPA